MTPRGSNGDMYVYLCDVRRLLAGLLSAGWIYGWRDCGNRPLIESEVAARWALAMTLHASSAAVFAFISSPRTAPATAAAAAAAIYPRLI